MATRKALFKASMRTEPFSDAERALARKMRTMDPAKLERLVPAWARSPTLPGARARFVPGLPPRYPRLETGQEYNLRMRKFKGEKIHPGTYFPEPREGESAHEYAARFRKENYLTNPDGVPAGKVLRWQPVGRDSYYASTDEGDFLVKPTVGHPDFYTVHFYAAARRQHGSEPSIAGTKHKSPVAAKAVAEGMNMKLRRQYEEFRARDMKKNPLTKKGRKIRRAMVREYGPAGKRVFYASAAKGTIRGVHRNPTHELTTESQVRRAFWQGMPKGFQRGKLHNEYNATIRSEFSAFVDMLARDGLITEALAQRVTLSARAHRNPSAWESYGDGRSVKRKRRGAQIQVVVRDKSSGRVVAYVTRPATDAAIKTAVQALANKRRAPLTIERVSVRENPTWHQSQRPTKFVSKGWSVLVTAPSGFDSYVVWPTKAEAENYARNVKENHPGTSTMIIPLALKNPASRPALAEASRRFARFTGHKAERVEKMSFPGKPGAGLAVGPLLMLAYSATRDGVRENYMHKFREKSRPTLVSSADGKNLFLLGGKYHFTERGIVDR
ncbi:MAG: hypothetical protein ACREDH_12230 [Methylocella sp.]